MRKSGPEEIFEEIIGEKIPNLMKTIKPQMQVLKEPHTSNMMNTLPNHIMIEVHKISDKEIILKAAREKRLCKQSNVVRTGNKRNKKEDIFQVLKGKNCQLGILYPMKLLVKNEGKTKTFITRKSMP